MVNDERDELESGLTSGFWQRLKAHALAEWGPSGQRYQDAVQLALTGKSNEESVAMLRMLVNTQKEIARLLAWPEERLSHLKARTVTDMGPSRRGTL